MTSSNKSSGLWTRVLWPLGLFIMMAGVANAQSDADDGRIEEIIVTATKVGEVNLQDTPLAITAFTGDALSSAMMSDVRDLEHATPGLTISENTGWAQIYIRGVGSNNVFAGSDPSSTIHMDGVYIARPQGSFNSFIDVERVEVLRGPQGTLYGRNSVGGTINIISTLPSFTEPDYKIQAAVGNEGFTQLEFYGSTPLSDDRVAASIAIQKSDRDAFQKNISTGNDLDDDDSVAIKGQLRFRFSDTTEAVLRADYYEHDNAAYGFGTLLTFSPAPLASTILGDYRSVAANSPNSDDRENFGISFDFSTDLNDRWTLRSLTSYRENEFLLKIDSDASDLLVLDTTLGEDQDQISQEFNFTGQFDRWSLLLGAYYFEENIQGTDGGSGVNVHPAGISRRLTPRVDTSVVAVFAQASFEISDRLTLTAGARYTDEEKDFEKVDGIFVLGTDIQAVDLSFPVETGNYSEVTPKLGLEYKVSDDVMVYGSATKGFKSGGFNLTAPLPGGFNEETLWAYEAGVKSDLADGKARLNVAAFYYDYEDLQVQSFIMAGLVQINNAATAEVTGLEVELTAKPNPAWDLGLNLAFLNAEYDSFPAASLPGGAVIDASSNALNNSPDFSGGAFAQYTHELANGLFYIRGEYSTKSEVFFTVDNNNVERQDSYDLFNAFAGYSSADGRYSVELFGRNLGDEEYITSSGSFTLVPAGRVGWPATYGIQFRIQK